MSTENIFSEWLKFAASLNIVLENTSRTPLTEIIRLVFNRLRQYRYLLVFDDVDAYDSIQSSLPFDVQQQQHILITTEVEMEWPSHVFCIRLESFTPTESMEYIRCICKNLDMTHVFSESVANLIHDTMEGLPLSLSLTMHFISLQHKTGSDVSFESFLDIYRTKNLAVNNMRQTRGSQMHSICTLCDLIFEHLCNSPPAVQASVVVAQLSALGNVPVPRSLIKNLCRSDSVLESVLFFITDSGVIRTMNQEFLYMHPTVMAALAECAVFIDRWTVDIGCLPQFNNHSVELFLEPLVDAICDMTCSFDRKRYTDDEYKLTFSTAVDAYQHSVVLLSILDTLIKSDTVGSACRLVLSKMKCRLQLSIGYCQAIQKKWEAVLCLCNELKQLVLECYGAENIMYARLLSLKAKSSSRIEVDSSEAVELYTSALQIFTAVYGKPHDDVAYTLCELGSLHLSLHEYTEAMSHFEQAIIMQRKMHRDESHPVIAHTLDYIATVNTLLKDYVEGLLLCRESLMIKKRVYNSYHPEIAATIHQIGRIYELQGKYSDALAQYEQALVVKRKAYGENHISISTTLECMAAIYKRQSKFADAVGVLQESLLIRKHVFGDKHIDIARTLYSLGDIARSQGRYSLAMEMFEESLQMTVDLVVEEDGAEEVVRIRIAIASVYYAQGKFVEALEHFARCIDTLRAVCPSNHPALAECLGYIGGVYESQGKYSLALAQYEEALGIERAVYGLNHVMVAQTLTRIAQVYKFKEKYVEALTTYDDVLQIRRAIHGTNHAEIASTLSAIGQIYTCQGKYTDGLVYLKQALEMKKLVYPADHQSVIASQETLTRVEKQERFREVILNRFRTYIDARQHESAMSVTLGMAYSREEKVAAAEFVINHIKENGFERINTLQTSDEYKKHEGPLTNGRLGKLLSDLFEEFYSSRDTSGFERSRTARGATT